ncbi:MAG: flagellar biosynthesis anti-sigma factor FlgM [Halioglobus sp.]|nr:flagellar biosynthesis anti-sigma factor FlgM [Halioglobus sp.]|tara:strand:+ start:2133 stop:2459 length:327 start_codon:yes stop_codon:yes gene_type:complete
MKDVDNAMSIKPTRPDMSQSSTLASKVTGAAESGRLKNPGAPAGSGQDTVTLTNSAAEMQKLEESLASLPDIDDARVAAIKERIENGSYQIDAGKIVDNLFRIEKDLS